VRGVTPTQYSLKRERFSSPVASTIWRPLNTVLNKIGEKRVMVVNSKKQKC